MVRVLTSDRINDLEQILQTSGALTPYSRTAGIQPVDAVTEKRLKGGAIIAQAVNDSTMEGLGMITGIENKPTMLLVRVDASRPVYQQVQKSILIVAAAIIGTRRSLPLRRPAPAPAVYPCPFDTLDAGMKTIGKSGDLGQRIPEEGG